MVSRFNKSRRGVIVGVVVAAPLVLASACSEPTSSFFDTPMSGGTGGASGGSAGAMSTGGTAGKGGTAATGGSASGGAGSGSGGADTSGGSSGNGAGGDAPSAGTAGKDPGSGGIAGMDSLGGEGGMGNEGGMSGGSAGTAGSGGTAGTAGTGGDGGTSGSAGAGGTAGSAGTAGTGGSAGMAGNGGNNMGGTGGAGCTPTTEVCDGADNDCGNDVDEGGVCPAGCHGGSLDGRTFLLCTSNNELEWVEAREFCMEADDGAGNVEVAGPMTLVEIKSAKENAFLVEWIQSDGIEDDVWMGANDRPDDGGLEGQWRWDRGSGAALLFYTVSVAGIRMPVNGAYHDFPTGQPTYNGVDCGIFEASDDFEWDDGACTQSPLNAFICGEIP